MQHQRERERYVTHQVPESEDAEGRAEIGTRGCRETQKPQRKMLCSHTADLSWAKTYLDVSGSDGKKKKSSKVQSVCPWTGLFGQDSRASCSLVRAIPNGYLYTYTRANSTSRE